MNNLRYMVAMGKGVELVCELFLMPISQPSTVVLSDQASKNQVIMTHFISTLDHRNLGVRTKIRRGKM